MNTKELHILLKTSSKLRRDECGDWNIFGKKGKIYSDEEYGDYWYLMLGGRGWNGFKKKLNFMEVWQDGDEGGALKLNRMPTTQEISKIKKIGGFGNKRVLSIEQREKLTEQLKPFRFATGHSAVIAPKD